MTARAIIFEDEPGDGKTVQGLLFYFGLFSERGQRNIIRLLEWWLTYVSRKIA